MIKQIRFAGFILGVALALSAVSISSASAALPLGCYKTDKPGHGIFSNATCTTEVAKLTGNFVIAEPLEKKSGNLWCALVETRPNGKSGEFKNATCTEAESDGLYTEVIVPEMPNVLPEGTTSEPLSATTSSGTSTFGSGLLELTSSSSAGSQSGNSLKLGSFTTTFKEVKSVNLGVGCTGLSNTAESKEVTVNGTFHIRDYKNGTVLATASILLIAPVHFSCSTTLVVVSGCVAGALTPENVLTKTLTLNLAKTGSDNTIVTVLNEANTANELCQLLAKEGSAATKLSVQVTKDVITAFKQGATENIAVLVMPL